MSEVILPADAAYPQAITQAAARFTELPALHVVGDQGLLHRTAVSIVCDDDLLPYNSQAVRRAVGAVLACDEDSVIITGAGTPVSTTILEQSLALDAAQRVVLVCAGQTELERAAQESGPAGCRVSLDVANPLDVLRVIAALAQVCVVVGAQHWQSDSTRIALNAIALDRYVLHYSPEAHASSPTSPSAVLARTVRPDGLLPGLPAPVAAMLGPQLRRSAGARWMLPNAVLRDLDEISAACAAAILLAHTAAVLAA